LEVGEKEILPQKTESISLSITPSSRAPPGKYRFKINATNKDSKKGSLIEVEYEVVGGMEWLLDFVVLKNNQEIKIDRNMEVLVSKDEHVRIIARVNKDIREESEKTGIKHFIFIERKKGEEWERVKTCTEGTVCDYVPERALTVEVYRARIVALSNTLLPLLTSYEVTLVFSEWSVVLSTTPQKTELMENEKINMIIKLNKELKDNTFVMLLEKGKEKDWVGIATFSEAKREFSYEIQRNKGSFCYIAEVRLRERGGERTLARSNEICILWRSNEIRISLDPERERYYLFQPIKILVRGYAADQLTLWLNSEGYNFWAISPSRRFGPEERIEWDEVIRSEWEIGKACVFVSYLLHRRNEHGTTEKKCFSVVGKAKWVIKLETSNTVVSPGEEITITARLCEDEACSKPFPLFSPYYISLIDSETKQAISPVESCEGKTSCSFVVKEEKEKVRTFYAIVSDDKNDVRGKSNEITIKWVKKAEEEKLPNLIITDIKIVDGIVFYKIKNIGKEKASPTCSNFYIIKDYASIEVDSPDYVDSLDVDEERWEAFEEEKSRDKIRSVIEESCVGSNIIEIAVKANAQACDEWGIKQPVKESSLNDNGKRIQIECQVFCKEYEVRTLKGCRCNDEKCNRWCQLEGRNGKCNKDEKCECFGATTSDISAVGLWYTPYVAGGFSLWYCYENKGYNETYPFCINLEIYEGDKRVFPSTPANYICGISHGMHCGRISPFSINKDATYKLVLTPPPPSADVNKENNVWEGKITTDFWIFLEEALTSNLPPFIYGRVGKEEKVLPLKGNISAVDPTLQGTFFFAKIISPKEEGKKPSIGVSVGGEEVKLLCKRPVSGKFRICVSEKEKICTQEIEYACLSSPPLVKPFLIQPISCFLSMKKESHCSFNFECERGIWIITNDDKKDKPLVFPVVSSRIPSLSIPPFTFKSDGQVKVLLVCFSPRVRVVSSTFYVSE